MWSFINVAKSQSHLGSRVGGRGVVRLRFLSVVYSLVPRIMDTYLHWAFLGIDSWAPKKFTHSGSVQETAYCVSFYVLLRNTSVKCHQQYRAAGMVWLFMYLYTNLSSSVLGTSGSIFSSRIEGERLHEHFYNVLWLPDSPRKFTWKSNRHAKKPQTTLYMAPTHDYISAPLISRQF